MGHDSADQSLEPSASYLGQRIRGYRVARSLDSSCLSSKCRYDRLGACDAYLVGLLTLGYRPREVRAFSVTGYRGGNNVTPSGLLIDGKKIGSIPGVTAELDPS